MIIETLSTFPDMYESVMGASMMRSAQESPSTNAIMMSRLTKERSIPPFSPVAC